MIRKNNLIAAAVSLALAALFGLLFMDPLIKWALVKGGEAAAGAKVAIGKVRTRPFKGRLVLSRVSVANKNEPFKNLFEFDQAAFQFDPAAALRAKIVITEASLTGLKFGTPREKSGALRRAPPSALVGALQKQLAPVKEAALSKLGAAAAPLKTEIDPKNLAGLKALDEAQTQLKAIPARWKDKLSPERIDRDLKTINESLKSLQGGGNSPADFLRKAKTAQEAQGKLKAMLNDVESSKSALQAEFSSVQAQLKKAEELKGKDLNGLMAEAGLPALDAESLTRRLVGPAAANKLSTALYWIDWARKRSSSPAPSAKAPEPSARRRGLTVEFPLENSYPAFLLKKARIEGTLPALFKGQDMALEGTVTDATSNAPLYGKPTKVVLKGEVPKTATSLAIDAIIDGTREPGTTAVSFHYAGIPLAGTSLGDSELGADIAGGSARVDATVNAAGEDWKGRVVLEARDADLKPRLGFSGPAAQFAAAALAGVRRFTVTVGFAGRGKDLHFTVESDLGQAVAEGIKKGFSAQIAGQRKIFEDKLNALYSGKAKDVNGQAAGLESSMLTPLQKQRAAIENAIKQAAVKPSGKPLPGLNKLFR